MKKKSVVVDNKWLRKRTRFLSQHYFHGTIPDDLVVEFGDSGEHNAGCTCFDSNGDVEKVIVDSQLSHFPKIATCILLHELAHVYLGQAEKAHHGPLFRKELQRLLEAGAFSSYLI